MLSLPIRLGDVEKGEVGVFCWSQNGVSDRSDDEFETRTQIRSATAGWNFRGGSNKHQLSEGEHVSRDLYVLPEANVSITTSNTTIEAKREIFQITGNGTSWNLEQENKLPLHLSGLDDSELRSRISSACCQLTALTQKAT